MDIRGWFGCIALCYLAGCHDEPGPPAGEARSRTTNARQFTVKGVVKKLEPDGRTIVIQHEEISNYMAAMTMPFRVKATGELANLKSGDEISFRLLVTADESWIDRVAKTGKTAPEPLKTDAPATNASAAQTRHPLLDYPFTNELGQAVSLGQFRGQALAMTFIFTRCPIPEYCPRLSKNFQEASKKLSAMPGAPTNWHFLSVTFDTEFDTPAVLKTYARSYDYDPKHWSFLTGPADKIGELARLSDVNFERDGASFNHGFRTLIIDPAGRLKTSIPVGGNLSDALVDELLKAAALTNAPGSL